MLEYRHLREFEMGVAMKGDVFGENMTRDQRFRGFLGMDPPHLDRPARIVHRESRVCTFRGVEPEGSGGARATV